MKSVVAIVLNWNRPADTVACVRSLQEQRYPALSVMVIDNGSTDRSEDYLRAKLPDVELIQTGRNLGFGGGCNVGISHVLSRRADYVWLVNNDATVSPETIGAMVALAEAAPQAGAIGAVIHDADGSDRLQCWGGGVVNFWLGTSRFNVRPGPTDFLSGGCLLMRCDAVRDTGMFDAQRYFMYWEDVDLCIRMRQRGWELAVADKTHVWHAASSSLGKKSVLADRYATCSVVRFLRLHAPVPKVSIILNITLRIGRRLLTGDWRRIRPIWDGWLDARQAVRT